MNEPLREADLRARAAQAAQRDEPDRLQLLGELVDEANQQLSQLGGSIVDESSRRLQLELLAQSLNAAICATNLLRDGYPRMALVFARLLREGSIAFWWTSENEDAVQVCLGDFEAGRNGPRGSWPAVGAMARDKLPDHLGTPSMQKLHDEYRRTHNEVFSHAVSNWSLAAAFGDADPSEWRPAVGPTYSRELVIQAADHLVPLFGILLADASDFIDTMLSGRRRVSEVDVLLGRVSLWMRDNPPPTVRGLAVVPT